MKLNGKKTKALQEAMEVFGISVELPTVEETKTDIIREADSVMIYFDMQGRGFTKVECLHCHRIFAYSYTSDSIKCCSIECMSARLRSMGLQWDPHAPLERRWGRYAPAIVPPQALEVLDKALQAQEIKTPKPAIEVDDLFDAIRGVGQIPEETESE
jgi:hypothetical protein